MSPQYQTLLQSPDCFISSSSQNQDRRMMDMAARQTISSHTSVVDHGNNDYYDENSMTRVVQHNNAGVDHIERQEYNHAFRCFRQALVLFKARFQEQQHHHTTSTARGLPARRGQGVRGGAQEEGDIRTPSYPDHDHDHDDTDSEETRIRPLSCTTACMALARQYAPSSSSTCYKQEVVVQDSSTSGFVLHTQCIRLLPSFPGFLSTDPFVEDRLVSAILVFNCGLVFHLQGQRSCSPDHLRKAFTLYQQAVALLQEQIQEASNAALSPGMRGKVTGNALIDILCMAVLNNMGLILRCDLLEHAKARRFFGQLVSCAHAFQNTYAPCSPNLQTFLSQDEQDCISIMLAQVDEFLLNAVASSCADPASAPAA